ncbi:hypothetical protein [Leptothermofonsia sp. ETS-13]|uniref:hypothetical protein n=1 Tax=Leptothermofonsia sp. ETS-13 TaxID=3035696 RepID=UPI003BA23AC0
MTQKELTQCLNLARALDLIVSSRTINGILYVYGTSGYPKRLDTFVAEYPLERLQAMANRMQMGTESAN